ncbi:MAG: hypothetical protein IT258_09790 [Saprospiraceae bacterium]|nr:hypothetical protein [Saprospiraceae bacterium]
MKLKSVLFPILLAFTQFACAQQSKPSDANPELPLKDLRWNANIILTQQLPSSLPDSLYGKHFRKVFAFSLPQPGDEILEVREIRKTVEKDSTFSGSKYSLPIKSIDLAKVKIINSPDGQYTALVIPAKNGSTFSHAPYGNEPERQIPSLVIGWYDHIQDRTLARALEAVKPFLTNVVKGKP